MFFTVVPARGRISPVPAPSFILQRDNWNDYGFQTQYQLYAVISVEGPTLIGDVKILKLGQTAADGHQLRDGTFHHLDEDFCSIGQSLDYYERIAELTPKLRDFVLKGLRDIIRFSEVTKEFHQEVGWHTSLFRYFAEDDEFIQLARMLLDRNYSTFPAIALNFSFEMPGWTKPLTFRFDAPAADVWSTGRRRAGGLRRREDLPGRVAILIGRNGSGKSMLLARLARIAHASRRDRKTARLQELGYLTPEGLGFTRIVAITYSAFDSFQVPGLSREERAQIAKDISDGVGRYVFCGLRDIVGELHEELTTSNGAGDASPSASEVRLADRRDRTLLKPIEQIADEFARTLDLVQAAGRGDLLDNALAPILADPSFNDPPARTLETLRGPDRRAAFLSWSTGHKIVLHVIASLVAHTEPKSIVLFDEPEAHLHPPLLAALMHGIRTVLESKNAFAIVATHSPVVLQETLARHVYVIRREGEVTQVDPPSIQTFGENIGTITTEVFGLKTDVTDYHAVLKELANRYDTVDEIRFTR